MFSTGRHLALGWERSGYEARKNPGWLGGNTPEEKITGCGGSMPSLDGSLTLCRKCNKFGPIGYVYMYFHKGKEEKRCVYI